MTDQASQIPDPAERAALNAALHATGAGTGFWDDHGRPAPWPADIDEWRRSRPADHPRTWRTTLLTSSTRKISRYTTSRDLTHPPGAQQPSWPRKHD
jgi:hypothetical protein